MSVARKASNVEPGRLNLMAEYSHDGVHQASAESASARLETLGTMESTI
jgi:hypothetical protein